VKAPKFLYDPTYVSKVESSPSYGTPAPSSYGPVSPYGAMPPNYGQPLVYNPLNYNALTPLQNYYQAPSYYPPPSTYYSASPPSYGAPAPAYNAPPPSYSAPTYAQVAPTPAPVYAPAAPAPYNTSQTFLAPPAYSAPAPGIKSFIIHIHKSTLF